MRTKFVAAALALLLYTSAAQAGPYGKVKNWLKQHPTAGKVMLAGGVLAGTSVLQWKASTYCEHGQPEHCNGGYGAKDNHQFVTFSIAGGAALLGAATACWKDEPSWKFCYALAYGVPAYQTAVGIKDYVSYTPRHKGDKD